MPTRPIRFAKTVVNSDTLYVEFDAVRERYFPRWNAGRKWRVRYLPRNPFDGFCDHGRRTIIITTGGDSADELRLLLIHEMCHALNPPGGHGRRWLRRMRIAAKAATVGENHGLAELINHEANTIENTPRFTAECAYEMIREAATERPEASFDEIVKDVAGEVYLTVQSFVKRYRRSKAVYLEMHSEG